MKTIALRVPNGHLVDAMIAMRDWLDEHRFDTASFNFAHEGDDMVVQVGFAIIEQADAFAARFAPSPQLDRTAA